MSYKKFYTKYSELLQKQYPSTRELEQASSSLPLCPFVIPLSVDLFKGIQKVVQVLYKMAHSKSYKEVLQKNILENDIQGYFNIPVSSSSVLMSYDFHISPDKKLKLIEVNTHSSGYLVSELVDQVQGMFGLSETALEFLKKSFQTEWEYFAKISGQSNSPDRVLIVDQQIKQQKMYVEFLMYKDFFKKFLEWPCDVHEAKNLSVNSSGLLKDSKGAIASMVYSRSTDFYWEDQELSAVKQAFLNQTCCVSPHPMEYFLLADKARLCDWSNEAFLDSMELEAEDRQLIKNIVPKTVPVKGISKEDLWGNRKQCFFKPMRQYGGKSVYRGKNLTQKVFHRILEQDFLCQESVPPPVFVDLNGNRWKYDIRVFVYKDQVQKLSARVYQGQVTGFSVPNAGFASVSVE